MNKFLLERIGLKLITVVSTPKEAIEKINHENFDLVISDMQMPNDGDGFKVLKATRDSEDNYHIPFIFWNSNQGNNFIREALSKGANQFIPKPAKLEEINSTIMRAMNGQTFEF